MACHCRKTAACALMMGLLAGGGVEGVKQHVVHPQKRRIESQSHKARQKTRVCDDLSCTFEALKVPGGHEWAGEAVYDVPFTMDYTIPVAVKSPEEDTYRYYHAIVDTGSANLGIAEASCLQCGGLHTSRLDVDYSTDSCIEVLYGDSEADSTYWKGFRSQVVEAGFVSSQYGALTTDVTFAAITNASSGFQAFFQGGYAGILGLAYKGIAEEYFSCHSKVDVERAQPLLDSLYQSQKIERNVFSISFCGQTAPLVIGGVDESRYTGVLAYTSARLTFGAFYGYYLARVTSFAVEGDKSSFYNTASFNMLGGLIIDSGTTALILPTDIYVPFARHLLTTYSFVDELFLESMTCLTESAVRKLPGLKFELSGGIVLELPAKNYLIYYEGCHYWGVSASTMSILGNIAMQGLTVVFDRDTNRIGFATAACSDGLFQPDASGGASSEDMALPEVRSSSPTAPPRARDETHNDGLLQADDGALVGNMLVESPELLKAEAASRLQLVPSSSDEWSPIPHTLSRRYKNTKREAHFILRKQVLAESQHKALHGAMVRRDGVKHNGKRRRQDHMQVLLLVFGGFVAMCGVIVASLKLYVRHRRWRGYETVPDVSV